MADIVVTRRVVRESVRPNPQAGQSAFVVPGRAVRRLTALAIDAGQLVVTQSVNDCVIVRQPVPAAAVNAFAAAVSGIAQLSQDTVCGALHGLPLRTQLEIPMQTIYTLAPAPNFLCEYEPVSITCPACQAVTPERDWELSDDFDADVANARVCPACRAHAVLLVQLERLTDAECAAIIAAQAPTTTKETDDGQ